MRQENYLNSQTFRLIRADLYKDQNGKLGFKVIDRTDNKNPVDKFITSVWYANPEDSINGGIKEMTDVIDAGSFEEINPSYYRDKNHFYFFKPMVDGGTFSVIKNIDSNSFVVLNSFYAKDKNRVYYGTTPIEGADVKTFKTLMKKIGSDSSEAYALDKYHHYSYGDIVSKKF